MVVAGYKWLLLDTSGCYWLQVVVAGYKWSLLVTSGRCWLQVVVVGWYNIYKAISFLTAAIITSTHIPINVHMFTFRCTWIHPRLLVEFVLLNILLSV